MHESTVTLPWYALRVKGRFENVVGRNLRAKGFEEFVPAYRSRRSWSDRVKEIEVPLFPGYVFCRFDLKDRVPVLKVPFVSSIISIGMAPQAVDDSELDALRTVVRSGVPCAPWPFLKTGENVELVRGPLRGLEGIVLELKNAYRLVISVNLLMRSVAVEVERDSIQPILRRQISKDREPHAVLSQH